MIELSLNEIEAVSGGAPATPAVQAAAKACTGLPSSTQVTITTTVGAQLGVNSTSTNTSSSITITTTCGDVTKAADKKEPAPPSRTASGTVVGDASDVTSEEQETAST